MEFAGHLPAMGLHGPLIAPDCRYDGLVARPYEPLADDRLERRPDQTLSFAVASKDTSKRRERLDVASVERGEAY